MGMPSGMGGMGMGPPGGLGGMGGMGGMGQHLSRRLQCLTRSD